MDEQLRIENSNSQKIKYFFESNQKANYEQLVSNDPALIGTKFCSICMKKLVKEEYVLKLSNCTSKHLAH